MPQGSLEALKWLFIIAGQQKNKLILSVCFAVFQVIFSLMPFVIIYYFLTMVLTQQTIDSTSFWWLALAAVAVVMAKFICHTTSSLLSHKAAFQLLFDLRSLVIENLGRMPLKKINQQSNAAMQKVVGEDIQKIEVFIAHHLPDMAAAILSPIIVICALFLVDWRLALAALIPLPLALLVQHFMFKGFSSRVQNFYAVMARMHVSLVGFVNAISVVKAFNLTTNKQTELKNVIDEHHEVVKDWTKNGADTRVLFQIVIDSGFLFVAALGLYLLSAELITLPTLIIFMLLGIGLMEPMQNLTMFGGLLTEILEGVHRIRQFSEFKQEDPVKTESVALQDNSIEFLQVGFRHPDSEQNTLEDISFKAEAGKITAIAGPSGAGKSTLIQLIPALLEASKGEIRLGGVDLREIPLNQLMQQISFVFQDTFLLTGTVFENIAMGDTSISEQAIIEAARKAQADSFIRQLPQGYDTPLGLNGHKLSGGESQRIAIARAIVKDSPVLVLDEATAFSDAENEHLIQQALNALIRNKTLITVTHRLQNLTQVDQIVVMDEGRIVNKGTHTQLLENCELYRHLWDISQTSEHWQLSQKNHHTEQTDKEVLSYV